MLLIDALLIVLGSHGWISDGLLFLAMVHIAAALFESYRLKENLVRSTVTGKRRKLD